MSDQYTVSALAAEWIEISGIPVVCNIGLVSALAAEWIEISGIPVVCNIGLVSALAAEWIEISLLILNYTLG